MSNWYKNIIKFSSWNLKFPEELYKDIDEIWWERSFNFNGI